ncbi:UNVERIFIED_CONTAM: hypothetical protein K2H54_054077 [Gekko kuhli]
MVSYVSVLGQTQWAGEKSPVSGRSVSEGWTEDTEKQDAEIPLAALKSMQKVWVYVGLVWMPKMASPTIDTEKKD